MQLTIARDMESLQEALAELAGDGEEEYEQPFIVGRLARDLDLAIEVIGAPTVREPDGLAMSSRKLYLSAEQRKVGPKLHEVLVSVGGAIATGALVRSALDRG